MNTPQAHLVDDDEAIRDALAWLLKSRGIQCTTYDLSLIHISEPTRPY